MNYVLMPLTRVDFEKIVIDSEGKILNLQLLIKEPNAFEYFMAKSWARNSNNDSYLLSHYAERDSGRYYIFFYKKKMYELWIEPGMFKPKRLLKFTKENPDLDTLNEIKKELTAAFAVYGDLGCGDQDGMNTVIPVFSEGQ